MSLGLEIASIGVLSAGLLLIGAAVRRLWSDGRAHASEMARLSAIVASQERRLAAFNTIPPAEPQDLKAGFVPARRRDEPETRQPKRPVLIAVPNLAPRLPASVELPAELAQRFGAIWDLADSGTPLDAIALATGHPIGQIELIIGLRRNRPAESRG
ncbi:MAG: hypothetical protein JWN86_2333 [Planctomycetota bacterium]|nr:hypothetical protein [Planctomycetota bacterium]